MKNIYKVIKEKGIEKDINQWRNSDDRTILMETTFMGKENILRWLLHENKFDVNEQNSRGITALHYGTLFNETECARLLIDAGSQNLKDRRGKTPLDDAKRKKHKEMQRLIESHFQLS